MIFVFGSNKGGIHGVGAARHAYEKLDAQWGIGEGATGKCYALPTKGPKIEFIPLWEVKQSVNKFLHYAEENIDTLFQVTQVGCGLGGFKKEEIAPLFLDAPPNCHFDEAWEGQFLQHACFDKTYWGTF